MHFDRKIFAYVTAGAMAAQGLVVGKLMLDSFKLADKTNFLADLANRHNIELDDFEKIAANNLGLLRKN